MSFTTSKFTSSDPSNQVATSLTSNSYDGLTYFVANLLVSVLVAATIFTLKIASTMITAKFAFTKLDFKPTKEMIKEIVLIFAAKAQMFFPLISSYAVYLIAKA